MLKTKKAFLFALILGMFSARLGLSQYISQEEFEKSKRLSVSLTGDYALIFHRLQTPYMGWGVGGRIGYDVSQKLYIGGKFIYYFGGVIYAEDVFLSPPPELVLPFNSRYADIHGYSYYGTVDFGYYILREKSSMFNQAYSKVKLVLGLGYLRFSTIAEDLQTKGTGGIEQHGIAITPGIVGTIRLFELGFMNVDLELDIRYHAGVLLPAEPPKFIVVIPNAKTYEVEASIADQDSRKVNVNQTFSFNAGIGFSF